LTARTGPKVLNDFPWRGKLGFVVDKQLPAVGLGLGWPSRRRWLAAWWRWVAATAAGVELAPVATTAERHEDPDQIPANDKAKQKGTHQLSPCTVCTVPGRHPTPSSQSAVALLP
jgi:hypothetical protein